jgi:hypothetical protein
MAGAQGYLNEHHRTQQRTTFIKVFIRKIIRQHDHTSNQDHVIISPLPADIMTLSVATARAQMKKNVNNASTTSPVVAICGGGNGAHVAAGYLASKGLRVHVLTRKPNNWGEEIHISTQGCSWQDKGDIIGRLTLVTGSAKHAIPTADIVFVAAPANAHPSILENIAPYLKHGVVLGALFAQGGFDWAAKRALGNEKLESLHMLFGLQNIPWICKATTYGKKAKIIGPKKCLYVAAYPVERASEGARVIEDLFDIPCSTVANFLNLTLTPSNQIIHPARYYAIFRDWDGTKTYTKAELAKRRGLTLCTYIKYYLKLTWSRSLTTSHRSI